MSTDVDPTQSAYNSDGVQFAWDATSLSAFLKCPRFYQYTNLQGWRKKGYNPHLLFGGIYAKALETFAKLRAGDMSYDDAMVEVVYLALYETYNETFTPEDSDERGPWDSDDDYKNRFNLIRTIIWYLEHFREDSMPTYHMSDGKPAVELSFRVEISDDHLYCGHLDRVVEYGPGGDLYIMDQKTSKSTIGSYYFNQFDPDTQMTGYTFAGQMVLQTPVKGVIIDAAQIMIGGNRFTRGFTTRTPAQLEEWLDETRHWINIATRMTEEEFFPMNRASCSHYGGCPFQSVCSKPASLRKNFLNADFEVRPRWDPLETR